MWLDKEKWQWYTYYNNQHEFENARFEYLLQMIAADAVIKYKGGNIMKKFLALALVLIMLFSTALAETLSITVQTTPVYPDGSHGNVHNMVVYEEMTGVDIVWDDIPKATWSSALPAMIAGEQYGEIIMKGAISNVDANKWGDEGYLIDLAPYLEQYAPNFYAMMKKYPTIEQAITNADGQIFGLPQVVIAPAMRVPSKLWFNTKALAAAGYTEFPKDLDGLKDLLIALKDTQYNIGLVGASGDLRNYFQGCFGLRTRGNHYDVVDVDPETHEIRIIAQSENFRKFMEYMHDLYSAGLLYQELFTNGTDKVSAQSGAEELGIYIATTTFAVPGQFINDWDGIDFMPTGPDGYNYATNIRSNLHSVNNFCITDKCHDIPLALQWVDYFYTDEGAAFCLCGVKGEDWDEKEDGTRDFTEAAYATWTDAMTEDGFKAQFGLWAGGKVPTAFFEDLFGAEYSPLPAKVATSLLEYAPEVIWPFFNWTSEQNEVVSSVESDIKKYVNTKFAAAVSGQEEITDEWWNNFVNQIDNMGAAKLLKVYQDVTARVYPDGNF